LQTVSVVTVSLLLLASCEPPCDPCELAEGDTDTDTDTDTDADADTDTATAHTVCADGDAPFATIQDAIDAAVDGDTITVCAGRYIECVTVAGVELAIVGDGTELTAIDAWLCPALSATDATLALSGLTLSGTTPAYGGVSGLRAQGATIVLEDLRIAGNHTRAEQAFAVEIEGGSSSWDGVLMEDNSAFGLLRFEDSETVMRHITLRANAYSPWTPDEGWLVSQEGGAFELANAIVYENLVNHAEAPLDIEAGVVRNVVFYANHNHAAPVFARAQPGVTWENGIFFDNEACGLTVDPGALVAYNAADANTWHDYGTHIDFCLGEGAQLDASNLDADPLFVDYPSWDFQLSAEHGSPCIDAGNPDPSFDDPDGSRNDMGAYGGPYGSWM